MADHAALGVRSAGARTRIPALLVHTSEMTGALAVADTLGPTVWRGIHESRHTSAGRRIVYYLTESVRAAG